MEQATAMFPVACEILGVPYEEQKIITAHVGNGGSIAAVDHGKCVDTSMGLTPVEGLLMGTRCGDETPVLFPLSWKKKDWMVMVYQT